jgi:CheY-like chemotaxis protein
MAAKYVLIADPDQKTLVKIEEMLQDVDVQVSVAADGAQALERALTVRQDLFIFADRLPIIDTPKLAEILRANPRTANVPLVLLRNDTGAAAYGDGSLVKPVHREPLVNTVLKHAFRVGAVQEGGEKLSGLLAEMPVPDLLQVLRANRREASLEITGTSSGTIWMRKGDVVDARCGTVEGLKAFFRLLEAREGRFTVKAGKVSRADVFNTSLDGLFVEAARQRDEIERLRRDRPLEGRLVLLREMSALPAGLHPVHRELLLLVEFYGTVPEIVDNARVPDLEAEIGLRSLIDAGIIGQAGSSQREPGAAFRIEPALMVFLKNQAGHTARRLRPVRVAVILSAAGFVPEIAEVFQPSRWVRNPDRVLGNQLRFPLDGEFVLQLDFYPPGRDFEPLFELPGGLFAGGILLVGVADDRELDDLNESAAALRRAGLPVEVVSHGPQASGDWVRKAFDVSGDAAVHEVLKGDYRAFLDGLRMVLVRRASQAGWSMSAR